VQRISDHDFREYAPAMLRRRVLDRVRSEGVTTISGLQERVLHEPGSMERFIDAVTFNASAPFADPAFFADFLAQVLPRCARFRTFACGSPVAAPVTMRLPLQCCAKMQTSWVASASTRPTLRSWPSSARAGTIARMELDEIQKRYARAGGSARFEKYVEPDGPRLCYAESLRRNIVFAQHNLATDGSFNEFYLIVARQVLAKYNRVLVNHAHEVIYGSLLRLGFLALGAKESLRFSPHQKAYDAVPQAGGCVAIFVEGRMLNGTNLGDAQPRYPRFLRRRTRR